jgi:hypothetical protein
VRSQAPTSPGPLIGGLAGAAGVVAAGVWLLLAPFASGYQPSGADWVDATAVGVVTGGVLVLLGLATGGVLVAGLRAQAVQRGLLQSSAPSERTETEEAPPEPVAATTEHPSDQTDLAAVLAPLAAALLEDVRDRRNGHGALGRTDPSAAPDQRHHPSA